MMYFYAQIDGANRCFSVIQTSKAIQGANMVALQSYDASVLGKTWNGSAFI